ncbi:MAG: ABC transporter permease [Actinomycetota bacterium]|nr:ABC transporter permease [Actinomycetota bacterium]
MAMAEPFVTRQQSQFRGPSAKHHLPVSLQTRLREGNRPAWYAGSLLAVLTGLAVFGPALAPHSPLVPAGAAFTPPGHAGFLLGSDSIGRDELSRVLYGIQTSWFSALAVIASGVLLGGLIGLVAGATGGWVDEVLMRFTDAFLALPGPVLAIAVVAALGPSLFHTLIAVGIVWWPFYARIVRGEVRSLAARPHLEAARLSGASRWSIMTRHLLPGALPAIVVTASLDVGNLILALAGLSFLGLGAPAPAPELGAMAARNLSYLLQSWWVPIMPALAIFLLAFASNIAGDFLRDSLRNT